MEAAYATTAAGWPLPRTPATSGPRPNGPTSTPSHRKQGAIVEMQIITDRSPARLFTVGDEVWWPVGRFRTVLTTPELQYVRRVATDVQLFAGQAYKLSYGLADWAGWVIHLLGDNSGSTPPVVKRVAKGLGPLGPRTLRHAEILA